LIKMSYRPAIFLFVLNAVPTSLDAYSTFVYDYFDYFETWEYSLFSFVGQVGSLLGVIVYWLWCSNRPLRTVFVVTTIIAAIVGCAEIIFTIGNDKYRALGVKVDVLYPIVTLVVNLFDRLAFMPSMVLVASSCPGKFRLEGTMFSAYIGVSELANLLSSAVSAYLILGLSLNQSKWNNLWIFLVICQCASLVPLVCLPLLPKAPPPPQDQQKQQQPVQEYRSDDPNSIPAAAVVQSVES